MFAGYVGICLSNTFVEGEISLERLGEIGEIALHPGQLCINDKILPCIGGSLLVWIMAFITWYATATMRLMHGKEYGTGRWGDINEFNSKNTQKCKKGKLANDGNRILSKYIRVAYDTTVTQRNNNQVIIGGSGSGKSAFILTPNLLNLHGSNVFTDPKGVLIKDYGNYLMKHNVDVQALNLCDMDQSMRYNPFDFIRDAMDVEKLANNIFTNTAPENYQGGPDPFWDNSATTLLEALMYYIWMECPRMDKEERVLSTKMVTDTYGREMEVPDETEFVLVRLGRDFTSLLKLADECDVFEKEGELSPMDIRMKMLEKETPEGKYHPALVRYQRCWKGAADTKRSILSNLYSRISRFDNPKLLRILSGNDLQLKEMGTEKKIALFIIIPETDTTYNFLPGILYTQLFQQLFDAAKKAEKNTLPIPVGFWADEFANIPMPFGFENILATARSYNVYISIFLQSMAQLKSKYKDDKWEGIVGNADTMIYLGGNEASTFKYISEQLGKWTIDKRSTGESKGQHGSSSQNYDVLGRELMTPDEVRMLPNDQEIVLYRSEYPMLDDKLKCWTMPEYKEAKGYGKFEIEQKEEQMNPEDFFECKGEQIQVERYAVDLLKFLQTDFWVEERESARNVSEEEILCEMSTSEFSEEIRELEEKNLQERIQIYEKAGELFAYILTPGAITEEQKEVFQLCMAEKVPYDTIYHILNPKLNQAQMETALMTAILLSSSM